MIAAAEPGGDLPGRPPDRREVGHVGDQPQAPRREPIGQLQDARIPVDGRDPGRLLRRRPARSPRRCPAPPRTPPPRSPRDPAPWCHSPGTVVPEEFHAETQRRPQRRDEDRSGNLRIHPRRPAARSFPSTLFVFSASLGPLRSLRVSISAADLSSSPELLQEAVDFVVDLRGLADDQGGGHRPGDDRAGRPRLGAAHRLGPSGPSLAVAAPPSCGSLPGIPPRARPGAFSLAAGAAGFRPSPSLRLGLRRRPWPCPAPAAPRPDRSAGPGPGRGADAPTRIRARASHPAEGPGGDPTRSASMGHDLPCSSAGPILRTESLWMQARYLNIEERGG